MALRSAFRHSYYVSPDQRRSEVSEETVVLTRLDARDSAGIAPHVAAYADKWGAGMEPWMLIHWSADACAALGVTGDRLAALAVYLDVERERYPWIPDSDARGLYAMGKTVADELEARFGARLSHPDHWPKERADARRRLRTALKALE